MHKSITNLMTKPMHSPKPPNKAEARSRLTAGSLTRAALRWIERGLAVFGALVAIYWVTLDLSVVVSPSMAPTLQGTSLATGDRVITEKISPWFRSPRRWDVITFTNPDGEKRMKRVAGLPGESVQILEPRELLIDGERVDMPSFLNRKYLRFGNLMDGKPVPCGDGYYVLGDDLKDSDDSRFNGPVQPDRILGRAWLIVWPLARFGFIR
jgi:signal peptidase I